MTKQLKDLFAQFSAMDESAQLEKIRQIRHHRSIERPAAAVKRVKKEAKRSEKKKTNLASLVKSLPADQRAALIAKLQGDLSGKSASTTAPGSGSSVPGHGQPAAASPDPAPEVGSSGDAGGSSPPTPNDRDPADNV